jgi:glucoamylase
VAAGRKDAVTTSLGPARVWASIGQGIPTEVYWPSPGEVETRDLGFILADGSGWWVELKAQASYSVQWPDARVPSVTVVHSGPPDHAYQFQLELVPDPDRDVLLIRYALTGIGASVYSFLATHLQTPRAWNDASGGSDNYGWVDPNGDLHATGDNRHLCLVADQGFAQTSVGYFGSTDLWQDFSRNGGRMAWSFTDAGPGFIVLGSRLPAASGVLAMAFANDANTCANLATQSLNAGLGTVKSSLSTQWTTWATTPALDPSLPAGTSQAVQLSATVMKCHQDRGGAIVAGLCTPWGDTKNDAGGYHLVWPRDAVEVGFALAATGHVDDAAALLDYLVARQALNGSWHQNFYPDGTVYWGGLQLDEVALPVMLTAKLDELGRSPAAATLAALARAVTFLVGYGPLTQQDRWEEDAGGSPFTIGVIIAALVAATKYVSASDAAYLFELVDDWNERLEEWCYVNDSVLDGLYGIAGHYVRIGAVPGGSSVAIKNQANPNFLVPYQGVIGLEFMYLARLGLRQPQDPRITATLPLVDAFLRRNVGTGDAYYRYDFDGYGEQPDGSNYDGQHGVGRPWALLAGERGHLAALRGEPWIPFLQGLLAMRSPSGLVPEQVWDLSPLEPGGSGALQRLQTGGPTLSATPLVWGHSELTKLAVAGPTAAPVERLASVAVYFASAHVPTVSHWRTSIPVLELVRGRDLAIEDCQPFTLHFGHDGWQDVQERDSTPGSFGLQHVIITAAESQTWSAVDFKRRYGATWESGDDHHVAIVAAVQPRLREHSGVTQ